ncbi:MAG: O-antigen ligase family protein [Candidatus Falkowbacteria bacterium]
MIITRKNKQRLIKYLSLFLFFDLLSILAHSFPWLGAIFFGVIMVLFLILAIHDFETGLIVVLAELFVGSQGHLFDLNIIGFTFSIRIAFWLIILFVFSYRLVRDWIVGRKISLKYLERFKHLNFFLFLFLFILIGLLVALFNHNDLAKIFFDVNAWLFFALLFPFYSVNENCAERADFFKRVKIIFIAALIYLGFKTLTSLYIFTHALPFADFIYHWLRDTRVGEITQAGGGFYRIFFQSHIYAVFAIIIGAAHFFDELVGERRLKKIWPFWGLMVLATAMVVTSFSRSFWLGLAIGLLCLFILFLRAGFNKRFFMSLLYVGSSLVAGVLLVAMITLFPWPRGGSFDLSLLTDRADFNQGESAISSRYALLGVLKKEICSSPLLGRGFGATVTYKSSDPRILAQNPDGMYTTYAFEWGFLDIWLKIGFLGCLAYIILLANLIRKKFTTGVWFGRALSISLISLLVINIFTPYLNHPLGIIWIILVALF